MTAKEIQETPAEGRSVTGWLREVAYQLAVQNEAKEAVGGASTDFASEPSRTSKTVARRDLNPLSPPSAKKSSTK